MKKLCLLILTFCFFNTVIPIWAGWKFSSKPIKLIGGEREQYMRPVWSPDGNWIAFTSSNYKGIWIRHTGNGEIKQISNEPAAGFGFRWSNNGEAIVSRIAQFTGRKRINEVKVFDVASGISQIISEKQTHFRGLPQWAEDDQHIYIFGKRELKIFESGVIGNLSKNTNTGSQIIYLKSGKIIIEPADLKSSRVLEPVKNERCLNLQLSPDRTKLAFEIVGGGLHVMNTDGTDLVNLGMGFRPQWAPDSKTLVYMISEDDGHRFTASDIYTVSSDGSGKSQLTKTKSIIEMNPSWSPDGQKIAFDAYNTGEIYVVAVKKLEEK